MRHVGPWLGLVVLVVTAGCGTGLPAAEPHPVTVTPAAVPTGSATPPSEIVVAPGINFARVEDPLALPAAHDSLLRSTSVTVSTTTSVRFPADNRTGRWRIEGRFSTADRYLVITERSGSFFGAGPPVRIEYFSDGEKVIEALVRNGSTSQNVILDAKGNEVPPSTVLGFDPAYRQELRLVLTTTTIVSVEPLATSNTSYEVYRLRLRGDDPEGRLARAELATDIDHVAVRLIVDERGHVVRYDIEYNGTFTGQPIRVMRTVRYTDVGTTVVEPPSWYEPTATRTQTGA